MGSSNFFRLFEAQEKRTLTAEELRVAVEAVNANIEKAQAFKRLALKFNDHKRFYEAEEEELMLRRLLAEYEILTGED